MLIPLTIQYRSYHIKYAARINLSRTAEDYDKDQPFAAHLDVRTNTTITIVPAVAGSLRLVTPVMLLQQLISHLPPALVLSIGLGAVSYSVFIRLTQKEDIREIRRLIGA